jgi:hypothetical protein
MAQDEEKKTETEYKLEKFLFIMQSGVTIAEELRVDEQGSIIVSAEDGQVCKWLETKSGLINFADVSAIVRPDASVAITDDLFAYDADDAE